MISSMFNTIAGKRIAVLGFAFQKDTDDTRESAAIDVCAALFAEHAELAIIDPKVSSAAIWNALVQATGLERSDVEARVKCETDAYAAAAGAHAFAVITEWDQFRDLNFGPYTTA
jgi:UDPglucose 6-dehydrogenase